MNMTSRLALASIAGVALSLLFGCGGGGSSSADGSSQPNYVTWSNSANGTIIKDAQNNDFSVDASTGAVVALANNTTLNGLKVVATTGNVVDNGVVIAAITLELSTTGSKIATFACSGPAPQFGAMTIVVSAQGWTYTCASATTPTPTPTTSYGSLAVNATTLAAGISDDYSSQTLADQAALSSCGGGACGVVVNIVGAGTCGAYAYGSNRAWGAASASSLSNAQSIAISTCTDHGGVACSVQLQGCN